SRRRFLHTAAAGGALAGLGDLGFLSSLPRVSAAEAGGDGHGVPLLPEIEPLVRLLEDTPREKLLEEVAQRIKGGTTYQEVLAALLLAGVRNIQPRPVGFKFHAVLVVNSAHLASISSPDEHRWLPIFWALDHFKQSQAQDVREGDWTMQPVDEQALPSAEKARQEFVEAMDEWDEAKADAAIAALARTASKEELFELFCRFGSRDFRSIGHKAIFVANSWRTLGVIGWQHAEPVLRSLAYALLQHEGGSPAKDDRPADRPGRENVARAAKFREGWLDGQPDDAAAGELLKVLHTGSAADACQAVVELINRGTAPQSVWDALLVGAGELLVRQPGIVGLHAVTTSNALRYLFEVNANDETRRLLLLQNAAFLPMFREAMQGRGDVAEIDLARLEPAPLTAKPTAEAEILADVSRDPMTAARKMLTYARRQSDPKPLIDAARVLVFLKGNDAHDYKFGSAVLEDYLHVSPAWRDRYLAAGAFHLVGSGGADNSLVQRTRAALGA
ncbi:MAG TPA: twin-arginine translocation signal domain-containing protein, partial [Pirellulales bacterium]|nr:twin-arginine translocation signal domain-containing protein [Pirellulales bacterium]